MCESGSVSPTTSRGRILEDPRFLLCNEILRIPVPTDQVPPFSGTVSRYMDVVRRAASSEQLLSTGVPYKGRKARLDTTAVLTEVMAGPKKAWIGAVERMADETYPAWRDVARRTGKRLPPEIRKELQPRSEWQAKRPTFIRALLDWLGADSRQELVNDMSGRLDAVLEFTIFICREFLLNNYALEKHQSDVFDQFQLQYLAFQRFVIVTADPDLSKRTQESSQAPRIMTFQQFLGTI